MKKKKEKIYISPDLEIRQKTSQRRKTRAEIVNMKNYEKRFSSQKPEKRKILKDFFF